MTQSDGYNQLERFDKVDLTGEQAMFFAFLDRTDTLPDVVRRRQRSYELLNLRPGTSVVDVGCGLGTVVRELAARIGPSGVVMGVDVSETMVAEARRRAQRAGAAVRFHAGGAEQLPIEDGGVQAYYAERLFQHLSNPQVALGEALRVLAPGGRVVLVDQDWDSFMLDSDDLELSRRIHRVFADSLVNGTVGRQFRRLLLDAGFVAVEVFAETVTCAEAGQYAFLVDVLAKNARAAGMDGSQVDAWAAEQHRLVAEDRFFMAMTHFVATGTRA